TGIASSEIAFTPQSVTNALGNPLLLMPLDDPLGAQSFRDDSGNSFNGACESASCPTAGAPGRFGYAVQFAGASSQSITISSMTVPTSTVSFGLWFNTSCADCGLSSVMTRQNFTRVYDRKLYLSGGNVCADVFNGGLEAICSVGANYADGQWHLAAQVL